jgi:hypothetical protein
VPLLLYPAAMILPSGWSTSARAISEPVPMVVLTRPSVSKVVSSVPFVFRRITWKSLLFVS